MTDIEWGAEIAVNGVRPEWLRDEDKIIVRWGDATGIESRRGAWRPSLIDQRISETTGWDSVYAIRLPATHPYYLATSRGFTYWPGGENAPED